MTSLDALERRVSTLEDVRRELGPSCAGPVAFLGMDTVDLPDAALKACFEVRQQVWCRRQV